MRRVVSLGALAALLLSARAEAFSTRVHIAIANDVRESLIASGNGTVTLRHSGHAVVLPAEDAQAIIDNPLEFRAGAVGPDNMAFPGMTDPSHAIEQRPFEQCELLHQEALTPRERAYAAGCFLHGATDAIAHHYVNYMSGETFTLTPITSARQSSWTNVVRHIVAESMIQDAAYAKAPDAFTFGNLTHAIPKDFVLRAYMNEQSPLWQLMAARAKAHYDAAKAANPGASLVTIISSAGLAPADHLVLAPVYLREVDEDRQALRASIEQTIKDLQNPGTPDGATLGVTPGSDGILGTSDDDTACTASCGTLYAQYKVYVALLEPRFDAGGSPLPSAFDKLSDELRDDLFQFLPAFMDTVENVSNKLNEPLSPGSEAFNISKADVTMLFAPMTNWADDLTNIDYATLTAALLPGWLQDLQAALQLVGVNIQVTNIIEALLNPVVQPVKDAIKAYAIDLAKQQIGELVDQYTVLLPQTKSEYQTRLDSMAPSGLGGTALDHLPDAGLYAHSFNIAATAIANHQVVLPQGDDPVGIGPASFDASHTPAWMQAGICDYLRQAVFPLGIDVKGTLSVRNASGDFAANVSEDSPIECHSGSLTEFASAPTVDSCLLTDVAGLIADPAHLGSVSRAHPPDLSPSPPTCLNITVEGLPPPPPGSGGSSGQGGNGGTSVNPGTPTSTGDDGGCGCRASGRSSGSTLPLLLLLAAGALAMRRRRRTALLGLPLVLAACGGDGGGGGAGGAGGVGGSSGSSGGSSGSSGTAGQAGSAGAGATGGVGGAGGSGGSQAQALLDALGTTVWHGLQTREGKERAYELRFDAASLLWAEIRNPYGPARKREMRAMQVDGDGLTVHTTVITPPGWPIGPENGRKDDWTVEILAGPPKQLVTTRGGVTETFDEGPWPAPTSGLTAILRVFPSNGPTADAFCNASSLTSPDRVPIWEFARGESTELAAEEDIVAGAPLLGWVDATGQNQFAVTDVAGFDQLGGTELSDQFNFIVRYVGTITHPGGSLKMRELDDDVKDGVWSFLGPDVGSNSTADLFLEVHGHAPADITADEPSGIFAAGPVQAEIMVLRCSTQIQDIHVQVDTGSGWQLVGDVGSVPQIDDTLFPPAL